MPVLGLVGVVGDVLGIDRPCQAARRFPSPSATCGTALDHPSAPRAGSIPVSSVGPTFTDWISLRIKVLLELTVGWLLDWMGS